METLTVIAWCLLAAVHLPPAAVAVAPRLTDTLYGVAPDGSAGVLLVHRGVLFAALVAVSALAALDPEARRAAALAVGLSVVGFLAVYARAGLPQGPCAASRPSTRSPSPR